MWLGRSEEAVRRPVPGSFAIAAALLTPALVACSGVGEPRPPPWRDQDDFAGVKAIAVGDDGTVYVGGNFTRMGPQTGGGVPVSATTGEPPALPRGEWQGVRGPPGRCRGLVHRR